MIGAQISANDVSDAVLGSADIGSCILDSCGVGPKGSNLLVAGVHPVDIVETNVAAAAEAEKILDRYLTGNNAAIFTLSYDLGRKMMGLNSRIPCQEPDLFIALFDGLGIHDYESGRGFSIGRQNVDLGAIRSSTEAASAREVASNMARGQYLNAIAEIKEEIRSGNTYQTNLTHCITAELDHGAMPESIFRNLRLKHPAPFAAYIKRHDSTVISASPELFFHVEGSKITASPIKGTRPRGATDAEDTALRNELERSAKDRAENVMIVDLIRNDLGRVCEFGSVKVDDLCTIAEHPSLFHLVSTVKGRLRSGTRPSQIFNALFPCGSITGAPKKSTMEIIDRLEPAHRGLSMGTIGMYLPQGWLGEKAVIETSVAIRTMVVRGLTATFNVGGGIVIDSDPASEYKETLTKAISLLTAIGAEHLPLTDASAD
ncbi:MAG: aminodeoxychorismate synthase component I [Acidobacteria bacterium]|nr:aminodeoxychorismate synthase component I [Acidobacteriota bacterium]